MTNIISNNGHQISLDLFFNIGTPPGILSAICVDDGTTQFSSTTTRVVIGTDGVSNMDNRAFTIAASRSGQTVTCGTLFGTGVANFTHKRVSLTNATASTSTTPVGSFWGGIDGSGALQLVKNSTFQVTYQFTITAANGGTGNSLTVNQGLQRWLDRLFGLSGQTGATGKAASIGADDGASAYVAGDTTFGSGSINATSKTFDSTPTRSAQTVTALATITASNANMTIKRLNINDRTSDVTKAAAAISGLLMGISNQTIALTGAFAPTITLTVTAT